MMLARAILKLGARAARRKARSRRRSWRASSARLLDQMQTERLSLRQARDAGAGRLCAALAAHAAVLIAADAELAGDPGRRRHDRSGRAAQSLLIARMARQWRASPPSDPVIAAGSTGSMPATAELLGVVARLPKGAVILPGLDAGSMTRAGAELRRHPSAIRPEALCWRSSRSIARRCRPGMAPWRKTIAAARARLLSLALHPAETTAAWQNRKAIRGARDRRCRPHRLPASASRGGDHRAADARGAGGGFPVARRRWSHRIATLRGAWRRNSSAATSRSTIPPGGRSPKRRPGVFLRLVAEMIADEAGAGRRCSPASSIRWRRAARTPAAFRAHVRRLERCVLRGPRPGAGLDGRACGAASACDRGRESWRRGSRRLSRRRSRSRRRCARAPVGELLRAARGVRRGAGGK